MHEELCTGHGCCSHSAGGRAHELAASRPQLSEPTGGGSLLPPLRLGLAVGVEAELAVGVLHVGDHAVRVHVLGAVVAGHQGATECLEAHVAGPVLAGCHRWAHNP